MPYRTTPLVDEQIYHVFNRGVADQPMFTRKRDCERFLQTLWFYHFAKPPVRLSKFNNLSQELKLEIEKQLSHLKPSISLYAFCLMPNHFHLLLKQEARGSISSYIKNIIDSYTKFFNIKYQRNGPVFQGQFKAVHVASDEQLVHLSRYIHLNPLTAYVVKDFAQLLNYLWSSLPQYLGKSDGFCESKLVLDLFSSKEKYLEFLQDQVEYQRELANIRHLILE
ncbi:MAG: transposase [Patescibacteria group bacterium]